MTLFFSKDDVDTAHIYSGNSNTHDNIYNSNTHDNGSLFIEPKIEILTDEEYDDPSICEPACETLDTPLHDEPMEEKPDSYIASEVRDQEPIDISGKDSNPQPIDIKQEKCVENAYLSVPEPNEDFLWKLGGDLRKNPNENESPGLANNVSIGPEMTPREVFELFFTDETLEYIVEQSQLYAKFKNTHDFQITKEDLKCFLGILIVSGYNVQCEMRNYWDTSGDLGNDMVKQAMSRNRFMEIVRNIHFADNSRYNSTQEDRIWKLRPLCDMLKHKFMRYFPLGQNLCYGESMVMYHGCKKIIHGKVINIGYKTLCMVTPEGYVVNFDFGQPLDPRARASVEALVGTSAAPIVYMIEDMQRMYKDISFNLFFNSSFTSLNLLHLLKENNHSATGQINMDSVPNYPSNLEDELQHAKRGTFKHAVEKRTGVLLVSWVNYSVVQYVSTIYDVKPVTRTTEAKVPTPHVIAMYKKNIGGSSAMDENVNSFRISMRSGKWWWQLFTWLVDVSVTNAWHLYRQQIDSSMNQLQFRREIVQSYLISYRINFRIPQVLHIAGNSLDTRYDRMDHYVAHVPQGKRRRCAGELCTTICRTCCIKCNVGCCINCFQGYHTKRETVMTSSFILPD